MGYTQRAIRGVSWVGLFRISTRFIAFLRVALLARILYPAQFGVYGIALIVIAFLESITETGVNIILVQEKDNIDKYINSAWIISIIRGITISLFIIITAPFIAQFFNTPDSRFLLYLIATVPFLRGFINPAMVKFQKELRFDVEFKYKFLIYLVDASVAVIASLILRSPTGIVSGLIAGVLLEVILSYIIIKPNPHFLFNKHYLAKMLHKGKWITISGIFSYLYQNIDDIVVGKILGTVSLGFYQMSYNLSAIPITEVSDVFSRVTFPIYMKISGDKLRLRTAFLKTILVISALSIPICLVFFLFPKQIILFVLGDKWVDAWPVFQILAILGALRAIGAPSGAVFLSVGKQKYITIITFVSFSILSLLIFPFVNFFGLTGAALATVLASLVALFFVLFYLKKILYGSELDKTVV